MATENRFLSLGDWEGEQEQEPEEDDEQHESPPPTEDEDEEDDDKPQESSGEHTAPTKKTRGGPMGWAHPHYRDQILVPAYADYVAASKSRRREIKQEVAKKVQARYEELSKDPSIKLVSLGSSHEVLAVREPLYLYLHTQKHPESRQLV